MIQRESGQRSFHSVLWATLLPEDHELLRIERAFNFEWVDAELAKYYEARGPGRPAVSPRKMFLMMFLEMYEGLSDYEVAERVRRDALFRKFAGFELEEEIPDHSTLSVFRERIGEIGFRKVFNRFVEELDEKKLISHRLKIVDATHMEADALMRGRVGVLRQAQRRMIRAMRKEDGAKTQKLGYKEEDVTQRLEEEEPGMLKQETAKLKKLLEIGKTRFERQAKADAEFLEEILFRSSESKSVHSLSDPEARPGHKSPKKMFYGYKAHTVTNESGITTTVETIGGNKNECRDLPELLKEESQRGLKGDVVLADGLYDSGINRQTIREDEDLKMQEVIPADHRRAQAEMFQYDEATNTLTCPQGATAVGHSPHARGQLFYFSQKDCRNCPDRKICPSFSEREHRARVLLSLDRKMRLSSPLSPEMQKALFRFRTIVERLYGWAKQKHGLRRARYRGRARVAVQAFVTFLVLNARKALRIKEGLCPIKPPGLAALGYA